MCSPLTHGTIPLFLLTLGNYIGDYVVCLLTLKSFLVLNKQSILSEVNSQFYVIRYIVNPWIFFIFFFVLL